MALRHFLAGLAFLVTVSGGCSPYEQGVTAQLPAIDPEGGAQQAMNEYDTNKDGSLDEKELAKSPGLRAFLRGLNIDRSPRKTTLTKADLVTRLQQYRDINTGLVSAPLNVWHGDKPVVGATVNLIPEKFLGTGFKPGSGTTDTYGTVSIAMEGIGTTGLHPGFYTVEIRRADGQVGYFGLEVPPDRSLRDWETKFVFP